MDNAKSIYRSEVLLAYLFTHDLRSLVRPKRSYHDFLLTTFYTQRSKKALGRR